jgi:serine protease AprX
MRLEREWIEELIYGSETAQRFTQDSPILPDVWIGYGMDPDKPMDVLLTPFGEVRAGNLASDLRGRLSNRSEEARAAKIAYNRSTVVASLPFDLLCKLVFPISGWWYKLITKPSKPSVKTSDLIYGLRRLADMKDNVLRAELGKPLNQSTDPAEYHVPPEVVCMAVTVGALTRGLKAQPTGRGKDEKERRKKAWREIVNSQPQSLRVMADWFEEIQESYQPSDDPLLYSVNRNREVTLSVWRSRQTVKADAANRLFTACCRDVTWAVVDSGIDAEHPAFRLRDRDNDLRPYDEPFEKSETGKWKNRTRIKATYDFSIIRSLLMASDGKQQLPESVKARIDGNNNAKEMVGQLHNSLKHGREVDWTLLEPLIKVPHEKGAYIAPGVEHGTHVAGILGADWDGEDQEGQPFSGVCPDINLLDIRVLDAEGKGDEFTVIAALQYLRWLNAHKDFQVVHGVNLSLSIPHDVANYACGRTPICEECSRLVNNGIVVVAAAGNKGYLQYMTPAGFEDGYRSISITDPGNTQNVITVGSTHRSAPHTYGVSYFSSRGPTGDGRCKPDLIAPGEKIEGPIPQKRYKTLDGTSMAAPHVSGAAALLIARNRELMGDPTRVKEILCSTATDLGRERYFQGCGLLDILRALQSV